MKQLGLSPRPLPAHPTADRRALIQETGSAASIAERRRRGARGQLADAVTPIPVSRYPFCAVCVPHRPRMLARTPLVTAQPFNLTGVAGDPEDTGSGSGLSGEQMLEPGSLR
jgi:hypothetical protein